MISSLKSYSHLPKKIIICLKESSLKVMKNAFYFILKGFFVLQTFKFFALSFWSRKKKAWLIKIRLISKFVASQPGKQTIAIHILPNSSRRSGNLTMKFGQLIQYNVRNVFFKNHAENETSSRSLFLFWKRFKWGKSKWSVA